jgi:hypothetical protein
MKTQKLNKQFLTEEYSDYKKRAFNFYENNRLSNCLKCIKYCGLLAWNYPIIFNFCDDELEELMLTVKLKLKILTSYNSNQSQDKVIFYNSQIINSGALTEQYLNYFIENNYKVLFIVPDKKNTKLGQNILETINKNQNVELYIASSKSDINKIREIDEVVRRYGASNAFLHFTPNDITGYTVFSDLTFLKRYFIVHNDHTFWFGKGCSDKFIEFRRFGYRLSIERRLIDYKKIYHLPFYPIIQKAEFQGFPFDAKDKIIGFSGANLYKYYLDPDLKFFYAIKELIKKNKDFIFCVAGSGDNSIVKKFVVENELQDRFFILGRRNDFYAFVGNVDILFESYPLKGGLIVLYGVENQKAITGIGNNKNASGAIEDFFDLETYKQPQNFDDFIVEADQLIKDKQSRLENAQLFKNSRYKKTIFDDTLSKIFNGNIELSIELYQDKLMLDDEYYLKEYLSLPDADFNLFYSKLFTLKSTIPFIERIKIIKYCLKLNYIKIQKRKIRLFFLVSTGY